MIRHRKMKWKQAALVKLKKLMYNRVRTKIIDPRVNLLELGIIDNDELEYLTQEEAWFITQGLDIREV